MPRRSHATPTAERLTRTRAVLLSHNHLALLHGLLDRPDGSAGSKEEWVQAAFPVLARFRERPNHWGLQIASRHMPATLVAQVREGSRFRCTLTARGRAILDRTVAAHLIGHGPYEGLRALAAHSGRR